MEKSLEFEDIRPFYDEEFQEKMKSLVKEDTCSQICPTRCRL